MTDSPPWPQDRLRNLGDRLRNLVDGLDNVLIALRGNGAAHAGVNVEFTPAEADELLSLSCKLRTSCASLKRVSAEAKAYRKAQREGFKP